MIIQVKINDEDYIAYNIYHYFHSPSTKKSILLGRLLYALISLILFGISIITGVDKTVLYIDIVVLGAFSIYGYFRYPRYIKKSIRKGIQKMKDEGKLPYDEEATIELVEEEIVETAIGKVLRIPYSAVLDIVEEGEYIYIRFGAQQSFILPHRCLDDKNAVLNFLHQKCRHIIQ